jgi:signal transduction histidine kinase
MSKLKKELQKLTKEQLIEQIAELYDACKPVKEYYKIFLNPNNIHDLFEKYKTIIINEFYPNTKSWNPKTRFSVAKKAITDSAALKPPPKLLAELMITLVENACKFTFDYGDMTEQFYDSAVGNFERALKYMQKEDLLVDFRLHCENCLKYADPCGYGFPDEMNDVFYEYYQ